MTVTFCLNAPAGPVERIEVIFHVFIVAGKENNEKKRGESPSLLLYTADVD